MDASKLFLLLALSAGTAIALSAPVHAADSSDPTWMRMRGDTPHAGADLARQNEAEKQRLEAQGFPQYTD